MQISLRERYDDPLFLEPGMDREIDLTFNDHPVVHVHPIKKPEKKRAVSELLKNNDGLRVGHDLFSGLCDIKKCLLTTPASES